MKKLLVAMSLALLVGGMAAPSGEDIEVPKLIKCDGCGRAVSSSGEACMNCSHPIAASVKAYQKLARIRAEEEAKGEPEEEGNWLATYLPYVFLFLLVFFTVKKFRRRQG